MLRSLSFLADNQFNSLKIQAIGNGSDAEIFIAMRSEQYYPDVLNDQGEETRSYATVMRAPEVDLLLEFHYRR